MRTRPKVVDKDDRVMSQYSGEHEGTWERDSNALSQASSSESFRTSSPLYSIYSMWQPENFIRQRSISQNIGKYKGGRSVFLYAWHYILSYQARGRLIKFQAPCYLLSQQTKQRLINPKHLTVVYAAVNAASILNVNV